MKCLNFLEHSPIDCHFAKNARNFVVEEIPLYKFSGNGEHLILKVRKKSLTTYELIRILSENLNIKSSEIGYAGLKDKDALTIQYLSINKKFEKNISKIENENIKILDSTYHENKLKIGHLKGNKFFIRLKKLDFLGAQKLQNVCKIVESCGFPNYFGFQRFGKNGDNFSEGRAILEHKLKVRNKKISKFLISAYQSFLFNSWLNKRVEFSKILGNFSEREIKEIIKNHKFLGANLDSMDLDSVNLDSTHLDSANLGVNFNANLDSQTIKELKNQPHFFKILQGDIMQHYPNGALFLHDKNDNILHDKNDDNGDNDKNEPSALRFYKHKIAPTGLLYGAKTKIATQMALFFEKDSITSLLDKEIGQRRFAWAFVENLEFIYKKEIANGELNFTLPKGSYATIMLGILLNKGLEF